MAAVKREQVDGQGSATANKRIKLDDGADRAATEAALLGSLGLTAQEIDVQLEISALPVHQGPSTLMADDVEWASECEEAELRNSAAYKARPQEDYDLDTTDDEEDCESGLRSPTLAPNTARSQRSIDLRIDDLDDSTPVPVISPEHIARTPSVEVEGTRVFPCRQPRCQSRFLRLTKLREHERRHQTPRAYGCNICRTAFTRSRELKRHLLGHAQQFLTSGTFRCTACGVSFGSLGLLQRHHLDLASEAGCRALAATTTDGQAAADDLVASEHRRMLHDARKPLPPAAQAAQLDAAEPFTQRGEYALVSAHVITALHGLISALAAANGGQLEEAKAINAICETLAKAELGGMAAMALRAVLGDVKTVHAAALQAARAQKAKQQQQAAQLKATG